MKTTKATRLIARHSAAVMRYTNACRLFMIVGAEHGDMAHADATRLKARRALNRTKVQLMEALTS